MATKFRIYQENESGKIYRPRGPYRLFMFEDYNSYSDALTEIQKYRKADPENEEDEFLILEVEYF